MQIVFLQLIVDFFWLSPRDIQYMHVLALLEFPLHCITYQYCEEKHHNNC